MDIKYTFRNKAEVKAVADKAPGVFLRNMTIAAKLAARDVQETARAKHLFRSRTGLTDLAIETDVKVSASDGVVSEVFLNEAVSPWGRYLHTGTGLYGPQHRKYAIVPKNRKYLRWPGGGGFCFAKKVMHPGIKGDPFIYNAADANQANINAIFNRYADRAAKEAGL